MHITKKFFLIQHIKKSAETEINRIKIFKREDKEKKIIHLLKMPRS